MKLDNRVLQRVLKKAGFYSGKIDGIVGSKTQAAIRAITARLSFRGTADVAAVQFILKKAGMEGGKKIVIDGFYGPVTESFIEEYLDVKAWRADDNKGKAAGMKKFPLYKNIQRFYGKPGTGHTRLVFPYEMRLAWDTKTVVRTTTVHNKCHDAFLKMLQDVAETYSQKEIEDLGLNLFGGCYNNRPMRGGRRKSTHAFAAAMDFDPIRNQLKWKSPKARLSRDDAKPFWKIVKKYGLVGLGPERNYDYMHVQAVRLG